ncbi:MAG: glycosyltransferase family 4 protein, partial [Verrucomicrobiota bacterium]
MNEMKVAYITGYDSSSRAHWSGSGYYIRKSLEDAGLDLVPKSFECSRLEEKFLDFRNRLFHRLDKQGYMSYHDPMRVRLISRKVDRWLKQQKDIDLVFSPGTLQIAYCKTPLPMASWSDATFHSLCSTYPAYADLSGRGQRHGDAIEAAYLKRCAIAFYASDWAAGDAIHHYGAEPEQVQVVPLGANFEQVPSFEALETRFEYRYHEREFLFVGVDWKRKGGDFVFKTLQHLRQADYDVHLRVIGVQPPPEVAAVPWVHCEGFVNKDSEEGRAFLSECFATAFALFVPSEAECYGLVYAEASAHACPSVARRVGGVPTVVNDDGNGLLINPGETPQACAARLIELLDDSQRYYLMCRN